MHTRESLAALVVRFFAIALMLLGAAAASAFLLPRWPQAVGRPPGVIFPPVFAISTVCLLFASFALSRAETHVAKERQAQFRSSLRQALAAGTCFVAIQSYALISFFSQQPPVQAATGATAFVAVAAALHGMHVIIAWLFLLFVILQAQSDRYDHEYHWGVTFCGWFWHILVIVWLVVLCVMAISNQGLIDDGISPDLNVN